MKRTITLNLPPLSDTDLILNAEELFLELDRRETKNDESKPRQELLSVRLRQSWWRR